MLNPTNAADFKRDLGAETELLIKATGSWISSHRSKHLENIYKISIDDSVRTNDYDAVSFQDYLLVLIDSFDESNSHNLNP